MLRVSGVLLVAGVFAATTACRNSNIITGTYATLNEVRQAGALDRGWIPSILPPGAHDIREAHDTSSPRRWGLFSFSAEDSALLRTILQPDETSLADVTSDVPGRIEWWPIILRDPLDPERISATGLKAYRSMRGDLIVAVNWAQRRAYYWTGGTS